MVSAGQGPVSTTRVSCVVLLWQRRPAPSCTSSSPPTKSFPRLLGRFVPQGAPARVVALTSFGHNFAKEMPLDDLNWERRPYKAWEAYGQSKLSNALFALELARRCIWGVCGVFVGARCRRW